MEDHAIQSGLHRSLIFRDVFDTYFGELCHFANTFLQDFPLSEDTVQETFIKYWKIRNDFSDLRAVKTWLYKTTRNSCLDHLKNKKTTFTYRISTLDLLTQEGPPEISAIELEEIKQAIRSTLDELPELTARIFSMSRDDDLTYPQIAKEMNLSVKSIEYHMSKVLAKMRIRLKDYLFLGFLLNI